MKPACKLVGTDGNVFALLAKVRDTLKRAGLRTEAQECCTKVFNCKSYDEALQIMMEYVEVE